MSKFGDVANAIVNSAGKTFGEMALDMARAAYPPRHPEVLFAEWLNENWGNLKEACRALGVEPPENGPELYDRLKAAIMPLLVERVEE
jgi:hypothetical protein